MASRNANRLDTVIMNYKDIRREFDEYKAQSEKKMKVLQALHQQAQVLMDDLKEQIAYLEELAGMEVVEDLTPVTEGTTQSEADGGEDAMVIGPAIPKDDAEEEEYQKKKIKSDSAKKLKPIKDVVNKVFQHLMGIERLEAKTLPSYPHGIDPANPQWPRDLVTSNPLMWFDWKRSIRDATNESGIKKIYSHIVSSSTALVPEAKQALLDITKDDLVEKIRSKWSYMASQWKTREKSMNELADRRQREEDPLDEAEQDENDMRVSKLYEDIDKIADPLPDKEKAMTKRKDGPVIKNSRPPVACLLANQICAWQVKPELLEEHPEWVDSK
ncbi:hypothetical protein DXG01_006442 [Tephrocybe rancida]|nr:hypothetical protein DXG01_006442 [Tephrocybe rancida]